MKQHWNESLGFEVGFATHKNTETGKKTSELVTTFVSKPANDAISPGLHYVRLKD